MTDQPRIVFRLTRFQQMCILTTLMEHWQCEECAEEFIDNTTDPPTVLTYGDLMKLFTHAGEVDKPAPIPPMGTPGHE